MDKPVLNHIGLTGSPNFTDKSFGNFRQMAQPKLSRKGHIHFNLRGSCSQRICHIQTKYTVYLVFSILTVSGTNNISDEEELGDKNRLPERFF